MKFVGKLEVLSEKIESLEEIRGTWRKLNDNQHQFITNDKAIMNWYPNTGTLNFQGKQKPSDKLKMLVERVLSAQDGPPPEHPRATPAPESILAPEFGLGLTPASIPASSSEEELEVDADYGEAEALLDDTYSNSELVLGLVGSVGTDLREVSRLVEERLKLFGYTSQVIKISKDIIAEATSHAPREGTGEYERISSYMELGNNLREQSRDCSILSLGVAAKINQLRGDDVPRRRAYIVNSLKSPSEVQRLRKIYSEGFFLIGVHADLERRKSYLINDLRISEENAAKLIARDADEADDYGQHTRDTYHLSDFFINFDGNNDFLKKQIWRILDLLFGRPYITPTFDEYSMFMAFSASLRSADLSRQVGAVLTKNQCIVSTGANDVPRHGGGLYWPELNKNNFEIEDVEGGRDYMRGQDSNAIQKKLIVDSIIGSLPLEQQEAMRPYVAKSKIKDITEYGRVVHAEMEALLSSTRSGVSSIGATLYCTTFPCHNCAKHIIAAGIARVVYVEPYPKSKAQEFHSDSISMKKGEEGVFFDPFIGVGPRSFFNLFSTHLGSGFPIKRKTDDGLALDWDPSTAKLRTQMLPCSYIERERIAGSLLSRYLEENR